MKERFTRQIEDWMRPHGATPDELVRLQEFVRHLPPRRRRPWPVIGPLAAMVGALAVVAIIASTVLPGLEPAASLSEDPTGSRATATSDPAGPSTEPTEPQASAIGALPSELASPSPLPVSPSPVPIPSFDTADAPRLVTGEIVREDGVSVARVALWEMVSGSEASLSEEWDLDLGDRDLEGAAVTVLPRPTTREVLILVRGQGAWWWTPGTPPTQAALPQRLRDASFVRWSPDGERLAGSPPAGERAVVLWSATDGASTDLDTPEFFHTVVGWSNDSRHLILYREPMPNLVCDYGSWLRLLDTDNGTVVPGPWPDDLPALGGIDSHLEPSIASAVGATILDHRSVSLIRDCDDVPGSGLDLPTGLAALDLEWSSDGRTLYLLAAGEKGRELMILDRPYLDGVGPVGGSIAVPSTAEWIDAIHEEGRWLTLGGGVDPCPLHLVLDTVTGRTSTLNRCRVTTTWLP